MSAPDSQQKAPPAAKESVKETDENEALVDGIVVQYLRDKGYHKAAQIMQESSGAQGRKSTGDNERPTADLDRYTLLMGLKADVCTGNNVLFWGVHQGNPLAYEESFSSLLSWISNSLDSFKHELYGVVFPLFAHCFLELMTRGFVREAKAFFERHADEVRRPFPTELQQLAMIVTPAHIKINEYAQKILSSKFQVNMSLLSFELLSSVLTDAQMFLLLYILNKRVNIKIVRNQPALKAKTADSLGQPGSIVMVNPEDTRQATDKLSLAATHKPEVTVEDGIQDALHPEGHDPPVLWGVFPTKVLETKHKSGRDRALQEKKVDAAQKRQATGGEAEADEAERKKAKKDEPGKLKKDEGHKPSKKDEGTEDNNQALAGPGPAKDEENVKVKIVQAEGPIPDRKDDYNSNILEKIVLRKPAKVTLQELEDSRVRVRLGPSALPSVLCHTFFNTKHGLTCTDISNDALHVAAGFEDSMIRLWRNDTNESSSSAKSIDVTEEMGCKVLIGHSGPVYGVSFSPDNHFALSCSADASIRLWSVDTGSNLVVYRGHNYPVWDLAYSATGYYFASASMDRTARLWSTDNLNPLRLFVGHTSDVESVRFHPNCNYLATGSGDKSIRLWDVQSGRSVRMFNGHQNAVRCLAFSPNGRILASAGEDPFINLWDLGSGKKIETLNGHTGAIYSLDFSKDGALIASGGADNTVRLWDMSIARGSFSKKSAALSTKKAAHAADNGLFSSARVRDPEADMEPAQCLMKTLYTKKTPVYSLRFTNRNLLLAAGCYTTQE